MWWVPSPRPLLLCRRILGCVSCQGGRVEGPQAPPPSYLPAVLAG